MEFISKVGFAANKAHHVDDDRVIEEVSENNAEIAKVAAWLTAPTPVKPSAEDIKRHSDGNPIHGSFLGAMRAQREQ